MNRIHSSIWVLGNFNGNLSTLFFLFLLIVLVICDFCIKKKNIILNHFEKKFQQKINLYLFDLQIKTFWFSKYFPLFLSKQYIQFDSNFFYNKLHREISIKKERIELKRIMISKTMNFNFFQVFVFFEMNNTNSKMLFKFTIIYSKNMVNSIFIV